MAPKKKPQLVAPGLYRGKTSRKFPDGRWMVRYRDASKNIRQRSFHRKDDALDFQAEVRLDDDETDRSRRRRLARTPFAEVAERWYEARRTKGKTPATLAGYRSILDTHLLPAFGDQPVSRIQVSDIEALLADAGVSEKTQRNILRVMSPIMKLAVRDGMRPTNPCRMVELSTNGDGQREMHFLSAEQVLQLAEEAGPEYRTLIYVAAYTGMRAGEIVALRVRHLDLMRGRVHIKESVAAVGGKLHTGRTKNKKQRTIALPSFLTDMLTEHVASKAQDDYVFSGAQGGMMRHGNFYGRVFRPARDRLVERGDWPEDLAKLRFHDLRHTCASLLIAEGTHPLAISRQLGHSSIAITMDRYSHLYPEDQEKVAEALEARYQRAARFQWQEDDLRVLHQP